MSQPIRHGNEPWSEIQRHTNSSHLVTRLQFSICSESRFVAWKRNDNARRPVVCPSLPCWSRCWGTTTTPAFSGTLTS